METVFTPPNPLGLPTTYAGGSKSQHPPHSISLSCPSNSLPLPLSQISTAPPKPLSPSDGDSASSYVVSREKKCQVNSSLFVLQEWLAHLDGVRVYKWWVAGEELSHLKKRLKLLFRDLKKNRDEFVIEIADIKRRLRLVTDCRNITKPGQPSYIWSYLGKIMESYPKEVDREFICTLVGKENEEQMEKSDVDQDTYDSDSRQRILDWEPITHKSFSRHKRFSMVDDGLYLAEYYTSNPEWNSSNYLDLKGDTGHLLGLVDSQIPWADDGKTQHIASLVKRDTGYLPGLLMSQIPCVDRGKDQRIPGTFPRLYFSGFRPSERPKLQISGACGGSHSHGGSGGCSFGNDWCGGSNSRFGGNGGCNSVDRHGHGDCGCCNGGSNGGRRGSNGGWHGGNSLNDNSDSSWHKSFFGFPLKFFLLCLLTCLATTSNQSLASFLAFAFGCVYLVTQPSCCQCCNMFKPSVFGTSVYKGACSVIAAIGAWVVGVARRFGSFMNEGIRLVAVVVCASLVTTITSVVCCASMVESGIMDGWISNLTNQKLYRTDDSPGEEPPAESGVRVGLPPLKRESLQRLTKPKRLRRRTKFLEKVVKVIKAIVVLLESLLSIFTE